MDTNLNNKDVEKTMCDSKSFWQAPVVILLYGSGVETGGVTAFFENSGGRFTPTAAS